MARKCNINCTNVGRIVKRLNQNINPTLFEEQRCGPSNHPSKWLKIKIDPGDEDFVPFYKVNRKVTYKALKGRDFMYPEAQEKWAPILGLTNLLINVWSKIHKNNIVDAKDKDILFRLCHRILPTRDKLNTMNVECPFCKTDNETIEHLFIYCKNIWLNLGCMLNL